MTPEEWDIYIADKRPEPGTYSKNEDWGEKGFPYGSDYKTREGPIDFPDDSLTTKAMHKGFKEGGWAFNIALINVSRFFWILSFPKENFPIPA